MTAYPMTLERGRPNLSAPTQTPFAEWLKEQRLRRGWSAELLGDKAGMSQGAISLYENGRRLPKTQEVVIRIADALAGESALPKDRQRIRNEALIAFSGVGYLSEPEHVPNEEELQRALMGYSGSDPGLVAAKTVYDAIKRAGPALTGEEPDEVIVRGRRKGITVIDE